MNFEANDMKVLGAIVGGGKTFKDIRTTTRLEKEEQEKILGFLVQSKLITATEGTNFLGQLKYYFAPTDEGTKKVNEYIEELKLESIYERA
jgi:hypothetical protein